MDSTKQFSKFLKTIIHLHQIINLRGITIEKEIKTLIIESLGLEDIEIDDIEEPQEIKGTSSRRKGT